MFSIGFGSENRETEIRCIEKKDPTTAVILAAVHFEWMLKRAILKLGTGPTKALREQLEGVYRINDWNNQIGYKTTWAQEVGLRFRNAGLGTVLGRLQKIQAKALDVRGQIVHGNGTVSEKDTKEAVDLFIAAGEKLREFAAKNGEDLDTRLKTRIRPRASQ